MKEFPIDAVVERDLIPRGIRKYKGPRGSYYLDCPFCKRKRKLGIHPGKDVGHCNYCGAAFNTVSLYAMLHGITNKEAVRELEKICPESPEEVKGGSGSVLPGEADGLEPAPLEIRDEVYRRFLELLTLSEKHKKDLLARGFSEEQVKKAMYRSFPTTGFGELRRKLREVIPADLSRSCGIPGFYDLHHKEGPKIVRRGKGLLIPVRTDQGLISGFQIRKDKLPDNASEEEKEQYRKYIWFSSGEKATGCTVSGCENIHFAGNWLSIPETVTVTEGVLKADAASALSGGCYLGLTGVNNTGQLPGVLRDLKKYERIRRINIAVDMDALENPIVAKARDRIERIIEESGIPYRILKWPGEFKGIDDFLLAYRQINEI